MAYSADNTRVFVILRDAIAHHELVKVRRKSFVRAKDGKVEWNAFEALYLSASQLDIIAEGAVLKIET
jgi:hypothetical protein